MSERGILDPDAAYATWSERLGAWLLDVVVVLGLLFVAAFVVALVVDRGSPHAGEAEGALAAIVFPVLFPAYLAAFHGGRRGQTPGKRAMGIAVRHASTFDPISYGRALGRSYLTTVLWVLWAIPGVLDGLWPLWDRRHLALHDKAARTVVLRIAYADASALRAMDFGEQPSQASRRRPPRLILLSVVAVLVVGAVLAFVLGRFGGANVSLPYTERFSGDCGRWSTQNDDLLEAGCVGGEYHVLVRKAQNVQFFTVPVKADGVRVEADVRVAAGPAPLEYGIGCFLGDRSGYWAALTPATGYEIVSYTERSDGVATAQSMFEEKHAISIDRTHHVREDCGRSGVALWVDGKRVVWIPTFDSLIASTVGARPEHFEHAGVVVFPSTTGSDVRFDNFEVERLPASK